MSAITRCKSILRDQGFKTLTHRLIKYLFKHYIWSVIPKDKTFTIISRSRVLTGVYFILKGTFYEEQRAVLQGIAKYEECEAKRQNPRHRLIRSTHRIEKGLSMRDRRDVFAEGYIDSTVKDLKIAWDQQEPDKQLRWAVDVLAEYFDVVEETNKISGPKDEYFDFLDTIEYSPSNRVPYQRQELDSTSISHENLEQLAFQRTSTRWFQDKEVPREQIDKALDVAMQSPSACNRQSYEFRFYDDPELISEVSSLAIGATGYNDNIPCLGVIIGKQRAYSKDRDRHVIYIDASLAAMAFQFSLETQGLASCCINWPAIPTADREISELLNLDPDEEVIMLMAIGHPDPEGMIPYSEKKPVENVRSFNEL